MSSECVFKDITYPRPESHDTCRACNNVPEFQSIRRIEMKCLCVVAGNRNKQKKYFGSRDGKTTARIKDIDNNRAEIVFPVQ